VDVASGETLGNRSRNDRYDIESSFEFSGARVCVVMKKRDVDSEQWNGDMRGRVGGTGGLLVILEVCRYHQPS
jgi:hypothetical protein